MQAGFQVAGYDIAAERRDHLTTKLGGSASVTAQQVGEHCNEIVLAVFNTDQVESLLESAEGACLTQQHRVICTSTCDPDRIEALAARIAQREGQLDNSMVIQELRRRRRR